VLPRLQSVSEAQADARAAMTGRVADSYTNIATVKLFSHAHREASYAREGMRAFLDTVHPQMRLVTVDGECHRREQHPDAAVRGGTWPVSVVQRRDYRRRHRRGPGPVPAHQRHQRMDHVGGIGPVREHRHRARWYRCTLALPVSVATGTTPRDLRVHAGAVRVRAVDFAYGSGRPVFAVSTCRSPPARKSA
jgi:hypothetical protein